MQKIIVSPIIFDKLNLLDKPKGQLLSDVFLFPRHSLGITEEEIRWDLQGINYLKTTELDIFSCLAEQIVTTGKKPAHTKVFDEANVLFDFYNKEVESTSKVSIAPIGQIREFISQRIKKVSTPLEIVINGQLSFIADRVGHINIYKISRGIYENNFLYQNSFFSRMLLEVFYPNSIDYLQYNIFAFDAIPDYTNAFYISHKVYPIFGVEERIYKKNKKEQFQKLIEFLFN